MTPKRRAVFFDRDGTLIATPEVYISQPEHVVFFPGTGAAISLLKRHGFFRIVVTNQAAVGRGMVSELDLLRIHNHMKRTLAAEDAELDAIYYAPYFAGAKHPEHRTRAGRRKPSGDIFREAAQRFSISLPDSFVVGDRIEDILAAHNCGAKSVLVRTGKGCETEQSISDVTPDAIVDDVRAAAVWICRQTGSTPLTGRRMLFVVAGRDFNETEYLIPRTILEAGGAEVRVAGPGREDCIGDNGMRVHPDVRHRDANPNEYDAIVFIGGDGMRSFLSCAVCQRMARAAFDAGRIVAAICIAPSILAEAGILAGISTAAWPTEMSNLRHHGAKISRHSVSREGRIVTAATPSDASSFADQIQAATISQTR